MNAFKFAVPLVEGVIEKRNSQFTMTVNYEGRSVACHCPTTGRIGNLDVAGRPCLLSASTDPGRKTPYTVEAISLNRPEDEAKSWIGINQNTANRYVEHNRPNYMTVPAAIKELKKIEMIRGLDRIYRMDHAVTATQKTILKSFGMDANYIRLKTNEISEELMAGK